MRIVQRQPEDEMRKCEVILGRALNIYEILSSHFGTIPAPFHHARY